jgi:2-iminoacetate synthase
MRYFSEVYKQYDFQELTQHVSQKTKLDVELALKKALAKKTSLEDYFALISPSADEYLEEMARLSASITLERFGKVIQLYMPLYISNECRSSCLYCGFSFENKIPRKTLTEEELRKEAEVLFQKGIQHVLILTGEDYSKTPVSKIASSVKILKEYFVSVSIEVYPMEVSDYQKIIENGGDGLTLYQETYEPFTYKAYHIRGVKKDMWYRLDGPDRGGQAGFRKIGIGALLGLANPLGELAYLGLHVQHLLKNYWKSFIQVSLPRLRPAKGEFQKIISVRDREFLRFLFALRIHFRDLGLVLSTREPAKLRDHLIGLGITQMSAESKTEPGGYQGMDTLEQFETEDKRSLKEIISLIQKKGFDPVIKDFDRCLV